MKIQSLQEIIQDHIRLSQKANAKGWHSVVCKVCNDHGRKGPRAGFKFENDTVAYHCFNCGHAAVYDPREHKTLSKNMVTVLQRFSVPEDEWQQINVAHILDPDKQYQPKVKKKLAMEPDSVWFPDYFVPLTERKDTPDGQVAVEYLKTRGVQWDSYPFYIPKISNDEESKKFFGRLIIPIFYGKSVVYYVGRDLTGKNIKKYLNPEIDRENVLFNYDAITQDVNTDLPLYVVEGFFDALVINGVAVFGNRMTQNQIQWLNKTARKKVIIPDRYGDGHLLAEQALKQGWSISTPDIGNCKDVNEAIVKYGKLYVLKSIAENTATGIQAVASLTVYCETKKKNNDPTGSKRQNKTSLEKIRK